MAQLHHLPRPRRRLMALTRMRHAGRRYRIGPLKRLEQAGDWTRLLEKAIQLSVENGDHKEAERLRQQLNPKAFKTLDTSEPPYTSEPPKRSRKRQPKSPPPSS